MVLKPFDVIAVSFKLIVLKDNSTRLGVERVVDVTHKEICVKILMSCFSVATVSTVSICIREKVWASCSTDTTSRY